MEGPCTLLKVAFMDDDTVTSSFACKVCCLLPKLLSFMLHVSSNTLLHDIQVKVPLTACPDQYLHMVTRAENNESFDETFLKISTVYFNGPETFIEINATGLPAGEQYHSNFSIKDDNGHVVDMEKTSIPFRKYNRLS